MRIKNENKRVRERLYVALAVIFLCALALVLGVSADTEHRHSWTYDVVNSADFSSATIEAGCACSATGEAVFSAPSDLIYDGTDKPAVLSGDIEGVDLSSCVIEYTGQLDGGVPVNAGHYAASVTLGGKKIDVVFDIAKKSDLGDVSVTIFPSSSIYTGEEIRPTILVADGVRTLEAGLDYTLSFSKNLNIGTAEVTVLFAGNYTGLIRESFTILPQPVSAPRVVMEYTSATYSGQAFTPAVSVYNDGGQLIPSDQYTVSYQNNTEAGEATLSIVGIDGGNYHLSCERKLIIEKRDLTVDVSDFTIIRGNAVPALRCQVTGLAGGQALEAAPVLFCGADGATPGLYAIRVTNALKVFDGAEDVTANYNITVNEGTLTVLENIDIATLLGSVTAPDELRYNGGVSAQHVTVALAFGEHTLVEGTDYTVTYRHESGAIHEGFLEVGQYTVTVTGLGDYKGDIVRSFFMERGIPADYEVPIGLVAVFGQRLSDISLPSGWEFKYPLAFVGDAGFNVHELIYTPSDSLHWQPVETYASVVVGKAVPVFTVPTDLAAQKGDKLSDIALPQGFSWAEPDRTLEAVGEHREVLIYTPEDQNNYVSVGDIAVNVRVTYELMSTDVFVVGNLVYNGSAQSPTVIVAPGITYEVFGGGGIAAGQYQLIVSGTGYYTGSLTFTYNIAKAMPTYTVPSNLSATYGTLLSSLALPEGFRWQESGDATVGNVGVQTFYAIYVPEDTDNYLTIYEIPLTVVVTRADVTVVAPSARGLIYNGEEQKLLRDGYAVGGTVVYSLSEDGPFAEDVPRATDADTYTVWYRVEGDKNHNSTSAKSISVTIAPYTLTDGDITIEKMPAYNGREQSPALVMDSKVTYTIIGNKATKVGAYTLTITGTGNYRGTVTKDWLIVKADPVYTLDKMTAYFGDTLGDVKLPEGFSFEESAATAVGNIGVRTFYVTFVPSDVDNYNVLSHIPLTLAVEPKPISHMTITLVGSLVYNGYEQTQQFTVSNFGSYEATYMVAGNKATEVDVYTMIIMGTGNFGGSVEVTYTIAPNTQRIDALTVPTVKSSDRGDIEAVKNSIKSREAKAEWPHIIEQCDALLARIDAVEKAIREVRETIGGADKDKISVGQSEAIRYADLVAKELLATDNLTTAERAELESLRQKAKELLLVIEEKEKALAALEDGLAKYQIETVKSTDKADIEAILAQAEALLGGAPSDSEEQARLAQMNQKGVALIARIGEAKEAAATADIMAGKNIDERNASLSDIPLLERAAADAEQALEAFGGNYTASEKTEIEVEQARVLALLEKLRGAAAVQDAIHALPDAKDVTPDKKDAVAAYEAALAAYESLSEVQQRYVDTGRLKSLATALGAYRITEGDGSVWKRQRRNAPVFKTNGLAEKMTGVTIGQEALSPDEYTVNEDGSVTISTAYLREGKRGEKSITIHFTNGQAEGRFTVKASLVWLWVILFISFLLLILCAAVLYLYEKERAKMKRKYPRRTV